MQFAEPQVWEDLLDRWRGGQGESEGNSGRGAFRSTCTAAIAFVGRMSAQRVIRRLFRALISRRKKTPVCTMRDLERA